MPFGLVSNCWKVQLDAGQDLTALIRGAVSGGFDVVELRQTCLGRFEDEQQHPRADVLAELAEFSDVQFDVALCLPFLDPREELKVSTTGATQPTSLLEAGFDAARAVAGRFPPHLRLVDLTTGDQLRDVAPEDAAANVVRIAESLIAVDGLLSVEHSLQPWQWFRAVFDAARERLGDRADSLKLCFDPVNLLFPGDGVDPLEVTRSLSPDEVSMIHFKQRRDGAVLPMMEEGQINWPALVELINAKGFDCPGLLEISTSEDVDKRLLEGRAYLRSLGLELAS